MTDVFDESTLRAPQTIREVGIIVAGIREDVERLDHKVDRYVTDHQAAHTVLESACAANTEWRRERQVWERLAKWAVGTNLVAIVSLLLAIFTFVAGR
jgi:hypothetical protein